MAQFRSSVRAAVAAAALLIAAPAAAQDLAAVEGRTTTHVLANGWTFIVVERPVAPVFTFFTYADVGGAQEVPGITGLAHMFEHMAFKGTPNIGTTDYAKEKVALKEVEDAYMAWQNERLKARPDPEKLSRLQASFKDKEKAAVGFVVKNEFGDIIDREGGTGLNAFTNAEATGYFYNLPANKFELFCFLESERFLHPVFREFYTERDVVMEERRLRTESQPIGRMIEQMLATAFIAHPYGQPVVGHMSDLKSITATDAEAFFKTYYGPSNLVTVLVGDLKTKEVLPLVEKYFGRIPARPRPEGLRTVEPAQIAERVVTLKDPAQPLYAEGYHKPSVTDPDQPVYDAIDDILSNGRASRIYRSLVRDKKLAVVAQTFTGLPGNKYPNLWMAFALPARGVSNEAVRDALRAELDRLKNEDVTAEELARFKTRAKADLIRSLGNNTGLAQNLANYQVLFGDWRELFRYIDRLDQVTAADIRRVAKATFTDSNRTVAMIVTETPTATASAAGAAR